VFVSNLAFGKTIAMAVLIKSLLAIDKTIDIKEAQ
jgi:hypothetical protein